MPSIPYKRFVLLCTKCGATVSEYNSGIKFSTDFFYSCPQDKFQHVCKKHKKCKKCGHPMGDEDYAAFQKSMAEYYGFKK